MQINLHRVTLQFNYRLQEAFTISGAAATLAVITILPPTNVLRNAIRSLAVRIPMRYVGLNDQELQGEICRAYSSGPRRPEGFPGEPLPRQLAEN
jgi:hypothetical protein